MCVALIWFSFAVCLCLAVDVRCMRVAFALCGVCVDCGAVWCGVVLSCVALRCVGFRLCV